ncbi:unnamed protein product [Fraxinus pennsylvanica]|uniref:LysM domain-containing protein n=1 Tax=Fraxinus pennsylvanica TaxID=56036 RepID=A0AAD2DRY9_9LAMI|nr:unnamed protein product [Fraxinus pennsylvanica]
MASSSLHIADAYCAVVILALMLLGSISENSFTDFELEVNVKRNQLTDRPCEEIYVVGEGETLHTISDKCGDPFIVEQNPHIHDPDDVFPGLRWVHFVRFQVSAVGPANPLKAHRIELMLDQLVVGKTYPKPVISAHLKPPSIQQTLGIHTEATT